MYAHLDAAITLEMDDKLMDPSLSIKDKDCIEYGPFAIIAVMQATHEILLESALLVSINGVPSSKQQCIGFNWIG
jgi:hypothetical protein